VARTWHEGLRSRFQAKSAAREHVATCMTTGMDEITQLALMLPVDRRAKVVTALLASLDDPADSAEVHEAGWQRSSLGSTTSPAVVYGPSPMTRSRLNSRRTVPRGSSGELDVRYHPEALAELRAAQPEPATAVRAATQPSEGPSTSPTRLSPTRQASVGDTAFMESTGFTARGPSSTKNRACCPLT
jgi:hypothetical protein